MKKPADFRGFLQRVCKATQRCCCVFGDCLQRFGAAFYRYHYGVGIHTIRLFRRIHRRVSRVTAPLRRWMRYMYKRRVVRPLRRHRRQLRRLRWYIPAAGRELKRAAGKNVLSVVPCFFRVLRRGGNKYWAQLSLLGRILGPAAAIAVLVITLVSWGRVEFALTLTYNDQVLGVIDSTAVYDAGAQLARDRVIDETGSFTVADVPRLTLTVRGEQAALTESQVCDGILSTAGDSIAEATGLYVDGNFIGAMVSHQDMQEMLDGIQDGYFDRTDKAQRAEFVQKVELQDGLYPTTAVKETADLKKVLTAETVVKKTYTVVAGDTLSTIAVKNDMTTAELRAMNPAYANTDMVRIGDELTVQRPQTFLRVKVIKTINYTEVIDYKTQTKYNDKMYVGDSKVITKGQEGSQDVVAEITYLDGVENGRKVLKTTVTKQPVTKVVEEGTKKRYTASGNEVVQGDGKFTGNWCWPVPVCHRVYQGYHRNHLAIDISSGPIPVNNKPCLAAEGGTVVYAGWYYGYGYYVKIDHGGGLQTTYAHLNAIHVVKGQKVSRGQQIALVGNTGASQGPHLHFEVIKNGVRVNPLNYVRP